MDVSQSNWSEQDASNSSSPPDGWPEGMSPNAVNDAARAMMGAIKRWYDWRIPTTTGGTSAAYTLTYSVVPTALADGMTHRVAFNAANTLSASETTLNVNGLGAKNIRKFSAGSWVALAASDLKSGSVHDLSYHTADSTYRIVSSALGDVAQLATANTFTATNDFSGGRAIVPTRAVADNGTDAASTAFLNRALRSYLAGLGTSNNSGTPNSKIDVGAGVCMDDTNVSMLVLSATTLDCGTTGANGLDAGSLANSTCYHLFGIAKTDGTTALLASTSISAPTYPSGYTLKRRIASFLTDGSAHIVGYIQNGDNFRWKTPVKDVDGTIPGVTTRVTKAVTVPTGVVVFPDLVASVISSAVGVNLLLTSLDETDTSPAVGFNHQLENSASTLSPGTTVTTLHTNTAAQIGYRVDATDAAVRITTFGWTDRRGKDA